MPDSLEEPYRWKKPRIVFVNSMSDLFHEDLPLSYIQKVFQIMNDNPHHVFQVLTKRAEILAEYSASSNWSHNIWMGGTVESHKYLYRMDLLRRVPARVRFVSFEPLLSEIYDSDLTGIDWAIVGGESGIGARRVEKEWILEIKRACRLHGTALFFKQWGGVNKKKNGRMPSRIHNPRT